MFSNSLEVHYVAEILTLGSTLDKLQSALISKNKRDLFGVSDLIKRWKSCFVTHEFRDFLLRYRPSSVEKKPFERQKIRQSSLFHFVPCARFICTKKILMHQNITPTVLWSSFLHWQETALSNLFTAPENPSDWLLPRGREWMDGRHKFMQIRLPYQINHGGGHLRVEEHRCTGDKRKKVVLRSCFPA